MRPGRNRPLVRYRRRPRPRARVQRGRRLRRVSTGSAVEHPGGRAVRVLARVPVRLAGDSRRGPALERRARLRTSRARIRLLSLALRSSAASTSSAAPTRILPTGPTTASGPSCRHASGLRGWTLARARSSRRALPGCAATSASRCAAEIFLAGDAAHRAADRRQGLNLALHDVKVLAEGPRGLVPDGKRVGTGSVLGYVPAARLAR